jgi:ureidoglycolate hydrolase
VKIIQKDKSGNIEKKQNSWAVANQFMESRAFGPGKMVAVEDQFSPGGWSLGIVTELHLEGEGEYVVWHMNYHPDGGQLFHPLENKPFVVPLAVPGDDLAPEKVVAFWCDGNRGLYIHPNIWHEGIFPVEDNQRFLDRQGKVHARVSCDLGQEFGVYLSCPLHKNKIQDR